MDTCQFMSSPTKPNSAKSGTVRRQKLSCLGPILLMVILLVLCTSSNGKPPAKSRAGGNPGDPSPTKSTPREHQGNPVSSGTDHSSLYESDTKSRPDSKSQNVIPEQSTPRNVSWLLPVSVVSILLSIVLSFSLIYAIRSARKADHKARKRLQHLEDKVEATEAKVRSHDLKLDGLQRFYSDTAHDFKALEDNVRGTAATLETWMSRKQPLSASMSTSTPASPHSLTPVQTPYTPPPVSSQASTGITVPDSPVDALTDEEMQKLIELYDELAKSEPSLGVVAMCTEGWFQFTPLLQDKFREAIASTASVTAELIEPKVGDDVDEATMRHGLLPRNYQKRVKAVKSLGFRLNSGAVVKPMVEIE